MSQDSATSSAPATPPSRVDRLTLILVVLAAASTLTAVSSTYVNAVARGLSRQTAAPEAETASKQAAYQKAVQFLKERQPHLSSVSDFNQSTVEANGNQFKVSLSGNQTAADGSMLSSFFVVELSFDGQSWQLLRLRQ